MKNICVLFNNYINVYCAFKLSIIYVYASYNYALINSGKKNIQLM